MARGQPDSQYAELFETEFPAVRRTVFLVVHDSALADDITQDAFVQALVHWRRVRSYDRPGAWVRRVAIRLAVRHLKREQRRVLVEASFEPSGSPAGLDPDVVRAVRELPPRQQAVLALFYYEDRPMKEIAELLDISESTGFVHLHRARRTLAKTLGEVITDDAG